ncbi:hypothetical protein EVAR_11574_1 [Eumeta japonica]|uniref:Uncharacterized protein n=1 Tax=Eumeta variegata TaxID=151549 RepID=A0A4C1X3I0_EUMVA|nr:hypothetical protein EVAR_11574_1 [Eumeta japonica]
MELRWERPSPGVPTVRPLSVHAYRRDKAIRRRDRTRQPVTTPQLVTPLESVKHGASDTSQTASFVGRGPGPARAAGTPAEGLVTYKQLKQNLAGQAAVQVVWDSYHDNLF